MQKKNFGRPAVFLLPFLLLYVIIILINNSDAPFGDENRYLEFTRNLLHGFYSPPPPAINLWNGPGFPLYLVPFLALNAPFLLIKLCNALLYYFALRLFYKTLLNFTDARKSAVATIVLGLYYMPYKSLPHILSETLSIFLIALIVFLAVKYFKQHEGYPKWYLSLLLIISLAFLALTKVIFGQVYLVSTVVFALLFIFSGKVVYKKSLPLLIGALLLCAPYLFYTWSLTGRIFYWSNAGGMSLYWITNPAAGEYGEWYDDSLSAPDSPASQKLQLNHGEEYRSIHADAGVARDDHFRKAAFQNLREHPGKVFINWMANLARMFFNYPVGYRSITWGTIGNMIANVPLLLLLLYAAYQTFKRQNEFPSVLKFLLIVFGVYFFTSSLLSAYDRMLYILTPFMGFWIAWSLIDFKASEPVVQKSK